MDFKQVSRCNSSLDLGRIWLDHSEYAITRSPITAPGVVVSAFWHVRPRDHMGLSQTYVRLTRGSDKASLIMRLVAHNGAARLAIAANCVRENMKGEALLFVTAAVTAALPTSSITAPTTLATIALALVLLLTVLHAVSNILYTSWEERAQLELHGAISAAALLASVAAPRHASAPVVPTRAMQRVVVGR